MARITRRSDNKLDQSRKVVPKNVRHILGRSEFKETLHGIPPGDRKRVHAERLSRWEAEISAARAKLAGTLPSLSQLEVDALCGRFYVAQMEERRANPGTPEDLDLELENLGDMMEPVGDDTGPPEEYEYELKLTKGDLKEAEGFLREQGVYVDDASIRRFAERLWSTKLKIAGTLYRHARGDWSEDHHASKFPVLPHEAAKPQLNPAGGLSFNDLFDQWAAERQPSANTLRRYSSMLKHFKRLFPVNAPALIKKEDVRAYKASRLEEKISTETIADEIRTAGTLCKWGIQNGILTNNPFAGMAPKSGRQGSVAKRSPYTDAQVCQILTAARQERGWKRWLPWLLCFTGARIGEMADLRRQDIRQAHGVWIIDVVPLSMRALKNDGSQRMIPIHPALIGEGFLKWHHGGKGSGESPLFSDLTANKHGSRADSASSNLSDWVRKTVGVKDPLLAPAHSFRHRMEDELRRIRAVDEAADAIMGHNNPRNAGAGYGRGYRGMPDETLKELQKVPSPLAIAAADQPDS